MEPIPARKHSPRCVKETYPPGHEIVQGNYVALKAQMPPTLDDSVKPRGMTELVKHVEQQRQLAWGSHLPGWLFGAEHWNVLSDVPGGGTKFEIIAVFSGAGPYVMLRLMSVRQPFTEAIQGMAEGLKTRCEQSS
ncbi:hypothetical protein B0H14DRAFT_1146135 [Mycena olivaceomarginata]|nr:hypothetical protein B0H14DRAFT_1146135 [Mycena olivaceomarginata]